MIFQIRKRVQSFSSAEILCSAIAYAVYASLVFSIPANDEPFIRLSYPALINYTIATAYLYCVNSEDDSYLSPYYRTRCRDARHLFILRAKWICVQTVLFFLPLLVLMSMTGKTYWVAIVWTGVLFTYIKLALIESALSIATDSRVFSALAMFLLMSLDCMSALGYFSVIERTPIYSRIVSLFDLSSTISIIVLSLTTLLEGGAIFGVICLFFSVKGKNMRSTKG